MDEEHLIVKNIKEKVEELNKLVSKLSKEYNVEYDFFNSLYSLICENFQPTLTIKITKEF